MLLACARVVSSEQYMPLTPLSFRRHQTPYCGCRRKTTPSGESAASQWQARPQLTAPPRLLKAPPRFACLPVSTACRGVAVSDVGDDQAEEAAGADATKPRRVLELEQRVHANEYDVDAWTELLRLASGHDAVCKTYESFLLVFPTAVGGAAVVTASGVWELASAGPQLLVLHCRRLWLCGAAAVTGLWMFRMGAVSCRDGTGGTTPMRASRRVTWRRQGT